MCIIIWVVIQGTGSVYIYDPYKGGPMRLVWCHYKILTFTTGLVTLEFHCEEYFNSFHIMDIGG